MPLCLNYFLEEGDIMLERKGKYNHFSFMIVIYTHDLLLDIHFIDAFRFGFCLYYFVCICKPLC